MHAQHVVHGQHLAFSVFKPAGGRDAAHAASITKGGPAGPPCTPGFNYHCPRGDILSTVDTPNYLLANQKSDKNKKQAKPP